LAGHDRARMRAVRNAARMQRDRAALDSAARAKIPAHIKQYLVGFDVVVHPWNLDRFGMRIEHARRERADHVATDLERLMDRRRLMDRACNRLEVLGVEGERIEITVPSHRIEWMM